MPMTFNLPTALTWLRIVLIPVFVGVYYLPESLLTLVAKNWIAMGIFAVAAITDWADGYLARRWGQTSAFGAFLDPVADKLIVAAALIMLVWLGRADAWLAIIIIGREIAVSALREWMAQLGQAKSVAVAFIGKVKTVAQITAIIALLLYQPLIPGINTVWLGTFALWVAAILTLWSMVHYLRIAAPHIRRGDQPHTIRGDE
jgi:CDP-diacylglycerol---glycerol-3-phosphate 3-phosphatidyltransferase